MDDCGGNDGNNSIRKTIETTPEIFPGFFVFDTLCILISRFRQDGMNRFSRVLLPLAS